MEYLKLTLQDLSFLFDTNSDIVIPFFETLDENARVEFLLFFTNDSDVISKASTVIFSELNPLHIPQKGDKIDWVSLYIYKSKLCYNADCSQYLRKFFDSFPRKEFIDEVLHTLELDTLTSLNLILKSAITLTDSEILSSLNTYCDDHSLLDEIAPLYGKGLLQIVNAKTSNLTFFSLLLKLIADATESLFILKRIVVILTNAMKIAIKHSNLPLILLLCQYSIYTVNENIVGDILIGGKEIVELIYSKDPTHYVNAIAKYIPTGSVTLKDFNLLLSVLSDNDKEAFVDTVLDISYRNYTVLKLLYSSQYRLADFVIRYCLFKLTTSIYIFREMIRNGYVVKSEDVNWSTIEKDFPHKKADIETMKRIVSNY